MQRLSVLLFSLCCLLLWSNPTQATEYTVQGQISSQQPATPSSNLEVRVYSAIDQEQVGTTNTDANGSYSITIDLPGNEPALLVIETLDICTDLSTGDFTIVEPEGTATVDLAICKDNSNPTDCNCPPIFESVCIEVEPGVILPFPNACEAECAGYTTDDFVECDFGGGHPNDCGCPEDGEEVCAEIAPGISIPFPNACWAECAGFGVEDLVECEDTGGGPTDCNCPPIFEEVCVEVELGVIIPFPNACEAECAGFTADDFVECDFGGGPDTTYCGCTFELDPVCVEVEEGVIIPFPNACFAECEGFDANQFVECDFEVPVDTTHCGCDCNWDPVCVQIDSNEIITIPNACLAECQGYDPSQFVECEEDQHPNECDCPEDGEEVCVEIFPGVSLPFPNACWAECAGFGVEDFVDCEDTGGGPTDCNCPPIFEEVCVEVEIGIIIPFPNACEAECAGFTADDFVECDFGGGPDTTDCGCTFELDPVCVATPIGEILFFPNPCFAECAGFDDSQYGECEVEDPNDCGCTLEIDEVCVELEPGLILTYPNACEAECAGFTADDFVECELDGGPIGDCGCTEELDPVCIELAPGITIPFPNPCLAECAGFNAADFVDCENNFANSHVVSATSRKANRFGKLHNLEVFPNPVQSNLNVELDLELAGEIQLSIFSMGGQQLKAVQFDLDKGQQLLQVEVSDLPQGLYLIQVSSAAAQQTLKFVKQ